MAWTSLLLANWDVILILGVVLTYLILRLKLYLATPSAEKQRLMLEWLSVAVQTAEEKYGSKAGEEKLRFVYQQFVKKYGVLSMLISEKLFNELVDKALVEMEQMIGNKLVQEKSLFEKIEGMEKLESTKENAPRKGGNK